MVEELKSMVGMDETIFYEGKPNRKCFIFESIFNKRGHLYAVLY